MIHWTQNFDAFGYHKSECGIRVPTKEVEQQKFEGVFRFLTKARKAVESGIFICPENYCHACWDKALGYEKRSKKDKKL